MALLKSIMPICEEDKSLEERPNVEYNFKQFTWNTEIHVQSALCIGSLGIQVLVIIVRSSLFECFWLR